MKTQLEQEQVTRLEFPASETDNIFTVLDQFNIPHGGLGAVTTNRNNLFTYVETQNMPTVWQALATIGLYQKTEG